MQEVTGSIPVSSTLEGLLSLSRFRGPNEYGHRERRNGSSLSKFSDRQTVRPAGTHGSHGPSIGALPTSRKAATHSGQRLTPRLRSTSRACSPIGSSAWIVHRDWGLGPFVWNSACSPSPQQ